MFEFTKMIIEKVSFDRHLFERELQKAHHRLTEAELAQLRAWCYERFGHKYEMILQKIFRRRVTTA